MKVNEKIISRRLELKLSDLEVATSSQLTIDEYYDIEWHDDEIFTVTNLGEIKNLCSVLKFDFFELFDLKCSFCEENLPYKQEYKLARNQLIEIKRVQLGISQDKLGDRIGFETIAIQKMESDEKFLEYWSMELINELASILDIPLQILLSVKCKNCQK